MGEACYNSNYSFKSEFESLLSNQLNLPNHHQSDIIDFKELELNCPIEIGKNYGFLINKNQKLEQSSSNETKQKTGELFDNPIKNFNTSSEKEKDNKSSNEIIKKDENLIINNNGIQLHNVLQRKRRRHTNLDCDNIKRKVMVKSLNFSVELINKIVKDLLDKDYEIETMKLVEFNYDFKKDITYKKFEALKNKSIISFLINDDNISTKNQYFKNHNSLAYSLIISKNCILEKIFEKSFFEFFSVFYEKKIELDLKNFGINKIIDLSNIKSFYEDTLKKKYFNKKEYLLKMEKVINNNFLIHKRQINFVIKK